MADGSVDNIGRRIKTITVDLKRYVEKRLELLALNMGEEYASWVAESLQKTGGLVLMFGGIIFLLIALALYLGALLNSRSLGFVLVSLPLLICGYLFFKLKPRSIRNKLKNEIEDEFLKIFEADRDNKNEVLSPSNSYKLENKPEHDA